MFDVSKSFLNQSILTPFLINPLSSSTQMLLIVWNTSTHVKSDPGNRKLQPLVG